jgi:hypothetical protein
MHINEKLHKVEENTVYYWNGEKWLVKEFCRTKKRAKELLEEIEQWKQNKQ